jgi:hypothetical protein
MDPVIHSIPIDELVIPRALVGLPVDILPVMVNEAVFDIFKHVVPIGPPFIVVKFPIIIAAFDCEICIIEPDALIIVGDVIVTPSLITYVPPATALPVAEFLRLVTVILVSIVIVWLFANTSSEAVGIMLPLHIAELLQLPEDIGHLFDIITL